MLNTKKSIVMEITKAIFILLSSWILPVLTYENIALRKPATQSSSDGSLGIPSPPVGRANDGNRSNVAAMDRNSCIHTEKGQKQAWWQVDLQGTHWIDNVYITYRNWTVYEGGESDTSAGRLGGFSIYVSDTTNWWDGQRCYTNTQKPTVSTTPYPCNAVGRHVTIYNDRNSTSASDYPAYYYKPTVEKAVLELCEVEIDGCPLGIYGTNCTQTCSQYCDVQDICFYNNGTCFFGCETGYYRSGCSLPCPDNCQGNVCQKDSGNCNSCISGWTGDKCDSPNCDPGYYGEDCKQSCPNCGGNGRCDYNSGSCNSGCKDGFHGTECQKACSKNCGGSGACNRTNGYCLERCKLGWIGLKCENKGCLQSGYYGDGCTQTCPNCGGDGKCNFESGICTQGCNVGWKGVKCNAEGCDDKKYGSSCNIDCPIKCGGNGTCDFKSGNCLYGCVDGWRGNTCEIVCQDNTFGKDCNGMCGQCFNGTCHHINGSCLNGCISGWIAPSCTTAAEKINHGNNNVPIIGGAVGGLLFLVIILIIIIVFRRKQRTTAGTSYKNGEIVTSQAEGNKLYQNVSEVNETKKNMPPERPKTAPKRPLEQQENHIEDDSTYYNSSQQHQKGINIDYLKEYITRMKVGDALQKEFAAIPYGPLHPHTIGETAVNKPKNRYKTTFPYDHSRVILEHGTGNSDYINANYIDSTSESKKYIATQGPIKPTIVDFWQMVWEQNIGKIVMLTNLKESVKVKCEKYWPDANQPVTYGTYVLTLEDERKFCYYVLREFNIQDKKTRQSRHVLQYHFTTWPDHGTPDPVLLVIFQKRISTSHSSCTGPTLVHCSAGIGRTGTYIGLDALLEQGRKAKSVDICDYVSTMRKNRMNMIQNADQYVVLHDALLEAFQMENTAIKMDSFRGEWEKMKNAKGPKNQQRLRIEYEKLTSLRPVYDNNDYTSANEDKNRSKNRNKVLALDKYRPYISSFPADGTNYINAVILPSLVSLKAFIVTQRPLKSTVADFWRLMNDHESYTIVLFEGQNDEKVKFFPQGKEEFTCDACSIDTVCANDMNEGVTEFKHKVHYKETDEEKEIKVYRVQIGTKSLPNTTQILKVVELVENWQRENGSGPCTVISLDGTTPCDVFCTVTSNMQRLRIDNEVDIFQTAYLFQQKRPEFFSQIDAYDLCFEAINTHLSSESVYFNS